MISFLKEIFKSKKDRELEIEKKALELMKKIEEQQKAKAEQLRKEEQEKEEKQKELALAAKKIVDDERAEREKSDVPWFDIVSVEQPDEKGFIKARFDWNPAFIKYLKEKCNFEGEDEEIIQKWFPLFLEKFLDKDAPKDPNPAEFIS